MLIDSETNVLNRRSSKSTSNPDRYQRTCIQRNATFQQKICLHDHIVRKHNRQVHACTKCSYKTINSSHFKRHMVKHPEIAGNRICSRCIYCNQLFKYNESLDDHILKIHPEFIASVSREVHKCTKCTYKTVKSSRLKKHIECHEK
ncbi:unnamed protein product [Callosobruchus maculatus]|uniref:C2H2-type domain-containing protein n=1 Tax=Callosobruchus maculatus TaxID=64391 RepID=A0A653DG35_CALMS|nr:unnamed protein product [Callosobruchus maculatus]